MTNFKNLLLSDVGGAWEGNEIISSKPGAHQVSKEKLMDKKHLKQTISLYFSDHGYAIKNNDTFFELAENGDLALGTPKRWMQFKKSLIIADSCIKYIEIY